VALVVGGGFWWYSNRSSDRSPRVSSAPSEEPPPVPLRVVPFTTLPGEEWGPTFSPDGSRIAFSWDDNQAGTSHIYIKLVGGMGEPLMLTKGPGQDIQPAWSPDGSQIAFLRIQENKVRLCTVPALPGPVQVLVDDLALPPHPNSLYWSVSWSPTGDLLAFPYKKSPSDLVKICLFSITDRKIHRELTSPSSGADDGGPIISPDGKWLAFPDFPSTRRSDPSRQRLAADSVEDLTRCLTNNPLPEYRGLDFTRIFLGST
jgi:Tol biopolymer transport system component